MIDRHAVRRHFSRAATSYDAAAVLQQEVASRMASRLPLFKLSPSQMLDVGAGTGFMSEHLRRAYSQADLCAVDLSFDMSQQWQRKMQPTWRQKLAVWQQRGLQVPLVASADALPIATARIDLLASSLMLQWCDNLPSVLAEFRRVLKEDAVVFLATLGPDTLKEIRQAWQMVEGEQAPARLLNFMDIHDLGDALGRAGFANPVCDVERITLTYANPLAAIKDLKSIGATNANQGREAGLMGKQRWQAFLAAYASQAMPDGRIPATFEVVYAHAWAGKVPYTSEVGKVASIAVDSIKRWQPK